MLLSGEAGMGKSRLVAAAETRARSAGFLLLDSRCFEPDRPVPYAPMIDLLRTHLVEPRSDAVARVLTATPSTLFSLVPELAGGQPGRSSIAAPAPRQERHEVFHALREFLLGCARIKPTLLVFEDLHWCDETTLDFLLFLARRSTDLPLLLLLSYRVDEVHPSLQHLLAELDRQRLAAEVTLAPLSRDEVGLMVRALLPPDRPVGAEFLDAIYALTEGNPFFVEEVLGSRALGGDLTGAQTAWDRTAFERLRVPRTVEDAVLRRLAGVSPAAQRLARLAAVAGRQFDISLLQALLGEAESALLQQLGELLTAHLIVEESAERLGFRHALTRQAIYAQLLARERQGLHRACADAIERRDPTEVEAHLADLAYHHYQAANWPNVVMYARRMGERAQAMHAPQAAIEHFSHALEAADALHHAPPSALLRARGQAYELQGDFARAEADYAQALAAARAAGERSAEWQLLLDLGFLWLARNLRQAGDYFQQALERAETLGDPARIAHSQNRLGNWYVNLDQPAPSLDLHRRALASFETLGDWAGVAQTLDLLAVTTYVGGDRRGAIATFERAAEQFRALDDRRGLGSVLATLAHVRCATHVYDTLTGAAPAARQAVRECQEALSLARAIGWRAGEAYANCELAACLSADGEYGGAFAAVREGQAIAEELKHRGWLAVAHATRGFLELDLLDAAAARHDFERAAAQAREGGSLHLEGIATALLALAYVLDGDVSRAEAMLLETVDPAAPVATLTQSLLLAALGEVRLARGDAEVALGIAERLIAWAEAAGGPGVVPRVQKLRGDALAALGQPAAAEHALRAAAQTAHDQANRPLLWRIHLSLGKLLQAQARRSDAEHSYARARDLVSELATTLPDAPAAAFRARALARLPAPRPLSPARAAREASGGLTARERQVAALIGRGLSNRQIAEQLVVSERTVESHTGHIRDKLGFTSRAQLAAWASARGLIQIHMQGSGSA